MVPDWIGSNKKKGTHTELSHQVEGVEPRAEKKIHFFVAAIWVTEIYLVEFLRTSR